MHHTRLPLRESFSAVKRRRASIQMNLGFQMALMALEKKLLRVEENSLDFFDKVGRRHTARAKR
jgi:hypothetical protein